MQFFVFVGLCVSVVILSVEGCNKDPGLESILNETEILWDRILQNDEFSIPLLNPVDILKPITPPIAAPKSCDLNVLIECFTSEGLSCNTIKPPNPTCAVGTEILSVTFGYTDNKCNPLGNSQATESSCQDFLQIDVSQRMTVLCQDAENETTGLIVEPPIIQIGGIFTITAPSGNLPGKIDCTLVNPFESQIQHVIIDSSGKVPLQLTDEFGSFTLLACEKSDASMELQSCLKTLNYSVEISNAGTVQLDLTTATFVFDDNDMSLLTDKNTVLMQGQSISTDIQQLIDLCTGSEYCAEAIIEAKHSSAFVCPKSDQLCIQFSSLPKVPISVPLTPPMNVPVSQPLKTPAIPPVKAPATPPFSIPKTPPVTTPVVSPVQLPLPISVLAPIKTPVQIPTSQSMPTPVTAPCVLELDISCTTSGNSSSAGKPCDTETLGLEPCLDRPSQITLLYNGGNCSQSDNAQTLKFSCADSNGGPPTVEGAFSFIVVTDIQGNGIIYFRGMVPVGSQYVLGDGSSLVGADMFINIFTEDGSTLLQAVQYHTSCTSSPLELKDRFGASQLVQFTNAAQGSVSCSVDFSFRVDISVPTSVTGSVALKSLIGNSNFGGVIDLTEKAAGETISSGGSVAVILEGTVDASVRFMYVIMFAAEGTQNPNGALCKGMDTLSFEGGSRPSAPSISTPTAPTVKGPTIPTVPVTRRRKKL